MSGRTRQGRRIAAAVALGVTLLGGGPATAGIVVLKNGEVLIGRINADEVDAEGVTLRWPYGKRSTSGRMRVPVERLRWFDASGDTLTDAYFAKHVAEPLIGGRWRRLQEEYKLRQEPVDDPVPPPPVILVDELLDWIATPGDGFEIRKPRGWSATEEDGILVLLGPRGSGGHPARIHVFTAPSDSGLTPAEQVGRLERSLGGLGGTTFRVVERGRLRAVGPDAVDQSLLTETEIGGRTVTALREVRFRAHRTYLFTAYADAADFRRLEEAFRSSLNSWTLLAD